MKLLNPQGVVIGRSSLAGKVALKERGYIVTHLPGDVMFAWVHQKKRSYDGKHVVLVCIPSGIIKKMSALIRHYSLTRLRGLRL